MRAPGFGILGREEVIGKGRRLRDRLAIRVLLMQWFLAADGLTVVALEAGENDCGDDGQAAEGAEGEMDAVDHLGRNG